MQKAKLKSSLIYLGAVLAVFVTFCTLFYWLGPYNFSYLEHMSTMYYDGGMMMRIFNAPGGLAHIISQCLIQFFVNPVCGVMITSALLTAISFLIARILRVIYGNNMFAPLALLTPAILAILHYNINYMYAGSVSLLIMLVAVNLFFRSDGTLRYVSIGNRILYCLCALTFVYALAGAVASLFAVTMMIIAVFKNPRQSAYYLLLPLIVVLLGYISMRTGRICDQEHALLPAAYFTHRLDHPSILYTPWTVFIITIVVVSMFSLYRLRSLWLKRSIQGICILTVIVTTSVLSLSIDKTTEKFKELNCYIRNAQWQKVIDATNHSQVTNLLLQNCLNMAMAEQGILADHLFDQPCIDIRNIYITGDSRPYIYMLLSDIYYSMGHIALAQRHAFEANESFGNMSPRMLQRLVDTNIASGQYKVAEKYISILERTLYYKDWARQRRALMADESLQSDPTLASKRQCITQDNRFAGIQGLDKDLLHIAESNPAHKATVQYLGALYLLSKRLPDFMATVDRFYGTEALPKPLPETFAEGVVAYANTQGVSSYSILSHYDIKPETLKRYEEYRNRPSDHKNTFWYFLEQIN